MTEPYSRPLSYMECIGECARAALLAQDDSNVVTSTGIKPMAFALSLAFNRSSNVVFADIIAAIENK